MLVKVSVMWTAASFSYYVMLSLNKYMPGTIYIHFYIDAVSGVIGYILGKLFYGKLRVKISFIISHSISLFGLLFIFLY
jgi:hypothetical protein